MDSDRCVHPAIRRLGVERTPFPPFRVYLVRCEACGRTLSTRAVAADRASVPALLPPAGRGTEQVIEA